MKQDTRTSLARDIMRAFALLTGLSSRSAASRRYLWTDAFGVCNFLCLQSRTGEGEFGELAIRLVDEVHRVLGKHRGDDGRRGWISGLGEEEGRRHPTQGGLRIGKKLRERRRTEPLNEPTEWDRDGQYYHYLTKWMHALNRVSAVTGDFTYNLWSVELAKFVHKRFVFSPGQGRRKRMYWKMSIDLSYPLVSSMGHHDSLDGLITYAELQAAAARDPQGSTQVLESEIADMNEMCRGMNWATDDPLGLGGLLSDAYRAAQLMEKRVFFHTDLLETLLEASLQGLAALTQQDVLKLPAARRLAFRELGLSIGLQATELLADLVRRNHKIFGEQEIISKIEELAHYRPLVDKIEAFWLAPENQVTETWTEHTDINMVMLATSLCPEAYLAV